MSYEHIDVDYVSGGEAKYKIRAGSVGGDTIDQDIYWADEVTINGRSLNTGGTQASLGGEEMEIVESDEDHDVLEIKL